jgi:hypothetical protein
LPIGVEAPGRSAGGGHGILDAVHAVGIAGIGVSEVVDLAVGAGAAILVVAGALQGLDVAAQVVGEVSLYLLLLVMLPASLYSLKVALVRRFR